MRLVVSSIEQLMIPTPKLHSEQALIEASWILFASGLFGLPVCSRHDALVGFFSMIDIAHLFFPLGQNISNRDLQIKRAKSLFVEDVMTSHVLSVKQENSIEQVIELLRTRHIIASKTNTERKRFISSLPVVSDESYVGLITYIEILKHIEAYNTKVADIIDEQIISTISPHDTVEIAHQRFSWDGSRLLVVVVDERPVGVVSDLQIMKYIQRDLSFAKLKIQDVMTDITIFTEITPDTPITTVISIFTNNSFNLRAFPITFEGSLVGLISPIDILRKL